MEPAADVADVNQQLPEAAEPSKPRPHRVRAARGAIVVGAAAILAGAVGWVYSTVGGAVSTGGTSPF